MEYEKYLPALALRNYVECYFIWRSPARNQMLTVDTPPNAYTAIVFNLADRYSVLIDGEQEVKLPSCFISGQSIKNYSLKISSTIDQVGIVFKPTGLYHLFDLPLYEFTNTRVDLFDVLKDKFPDIIEKLSEAKNAVVKKDIIENILLTILVKKSPELDGVDQGALQILDQFGQICVGNLVDNAFMSRRKFERHFFKRVGLSPKYYARIRRYGYLCSLFAGQRNVNWDQVLYRVGYYDQSHFIKDFKEFSGLSPNQYLISNNELAHKVQPKTIN